MDVIQTDVIVSASQPLRRACWYLLYGSGMKSSLRIRVEWMKSLTAELQIP